MKSVLVWLWLFVSVLFFTLAGCSGDTSGGPDAQSDAKSDVTVESGVDSGADVVTTSFNVTQAASVTATKMTVTFDAPPDPKQAVVVSNYSVPSLTLSSPSLVGNTVTFTTSAQAATQYTVTVSGVTRASDAKALTKTTADFTGRAPFDVTAAASVDSQTITVTFDAPPSATQATTLSSYAVQGLTLTGTPQLAGNTVTLTTSNQGSSPYTVKVSNVTRASDGEPLLVDQATFNGTPTFNVSSALSTGNKQMTVTFDAPPDAAQATTLGSYAVSGLALSGTPQLAGNTVTITTDAQSAQSYTVTVTGVTRASDAAPLVTNQAQFTGHTSFNVTAAASLTTSSITVTFDAPPDPTQATTLANYSVQGLVLQGKIALNGSTVTIGTATQSATQYTVVVSNVTRASDSEPLTNATADFNGRLPFDVSTASSTSAVTLTVTFDAPPNPGLATTLGNYTVQGLTLSGTPVLSGSTVTILSSPQTATSYTVNVANVTRALDNEPLTAKDATFTGTAVQAPTVTNVAVTSTSPNNGTTPYNTGTVTVKITGTDFTTVTCPTGVKLDDLDGAGNAVGTQPTSCTVDSDTQITATWPAGLRTNGTTGWNVLVTNGVGSNATSAVQLAPVAGLLISEIYTGTSGLTDHEFIEIYNPTGTSIDTTGTGIGLKLHTRSSGGADTNKTLTAVTTGIIPSHGFLLVASSASVSGEAWFASRDYTYSASLVGNGGAYISMSATKDLKVIDKVGWGTQPAGGYEGTALADISSNNSVERKPAGGQGDAIDTDVNASDFDAQSTTLTPKGTVDATEP